MQTRPNYIILDGAKMQLSLEKAKELNPQHQCLFQGNQAKNMGGAAPWLFTYSVNAPLAQWLLEESKEQNWGVLFYSQQPLEIIVQHLLKLLSAQTSIGQQYYFRYYDPRVLNAFLPNCSVDQLHAFFGPIASFFSETTNDYLFHYSIHSNQNALQKETITRANFFQKGGIRIVG